MTRSMRLSTPARHLSQQTCRRFLSTSRPATRLSAFSVGEIVPRRETVVASASLSRPSVPRPLISCSRLRAPVASFSSSSVRPATKVIQNPRAGDDGETLMINISPRAVEVGLHHLIRFLFYCFEGLGSCSIPVGCEYKGSRSSA